MGENDEGWGLKRFEPDYKMSKGEVLRQYINHNFISVEALGNNIGLTFGESKRLLKNKLEIDNDLAECLEDYTKILKSFWLEWRRYLNGQWVFVKIPEIQVKARNLKKSVVKNYMVTLCLFIMIIWKDIMKLN